MSAQERSPAQRQVIAPYVNPYAEIEHEISNLPGARDGHPAANADLLVQRTNDSRNDSYKKTYEDQSIVEQISPGGPCTTNTGATTVDAGSTSVDRESSSRTKGHARELDEHEKRAFVVDVRNEATMTKREPRHNLHYNVGSG
ncbi:unnamed protein product, partial [Amoebophrya sp. A25]|eukprot:GSA25T00015167001.1